MKRALLYWSERLTKLLTVKSIITLILTSVFAVMVLRGLISAELFIPIFTTVIAFYFGTQSNKKEEGKN